jgi:hypothetical protein
VEHDGAPTGFGVEDVADAGRKDLEEGGEGGREEYNIEMSAPGQLRVRGRMLLEQSSSNITCMGSAPGRLWISRKSRSKAGRSSVTSGSGPSTMTGRVRTKTEVLTS